MTSAGPLRGCRVVVTRGTEKADPLPALLEDAGASVVRVPLIATDRIAGDDELRAAMRRLRDGRDRAPAAPAWLVVTSATAVRLVLDAAGSDGTAGIAVAAVGPATAEALRARGVIADLVAAGQDADSLAAELTARDLAGAAVLVIAAAGGRAVVGPALVAAGARVEVIEAYRSVMPPGAAARLRDELAARPPHAITFTSGSTVRHCARALGGALPPGLVALCIGPVTAAAAREAGFDGVVTASDHTAAGVVAAAVARLAAAHPLP
jgi:uroporphyrinogen III methyltransferase/synthase